MIVDLPHTSTAKVAKELSLMREHGGVVTLGRVLTLVILTRSGAEEKAIEAANLASREHPCRIIVLASGLSCDPTHLDAQIRVGGNAGASEVIVLHGHGELARQSESLVAALLLPDAPIVAWWPHELPEHPASTAVGAIACRRITDTATAGDPRGALEQLRSSYTPADTDLAWTRLTHWRIQLAAAFDQLGSPLVRAVTVAGAVDSPSTFLLAAWLARDLGAPATVHHTAAGTGMASVAVDSDCGQVLLTRANQEPGLALLAIPGQPQQKIVLTRPTLQSCLAEELRRLDPDTVFGDVLQNGLAVLFNGHQLNGYQVNESFS